MRLYKQIFKRKGQPPTESSKYYVDVRIEGKRKRLPLFESKERSQQFLSRLEILLAQYEAGNGYERDVQQWLTQITPKLLQRLARMGLVSAAKAETGKPISDHIKDYLGYLKNKGNSEPYMKLCKTRIQKIIVGCRFYRLADLDASKIQGYVSDEVAAGNLSQSSGNHYLRQIKGFLRWLYREDRIHNALDKYLHMRRITEGSTGRRALTIEEISYLLNWLTSQAKRRRSLMGWERATLYKLALTTGLRANEIRHLKAASIDFLNKTVHLSSAYAKNRSEAILPLREDVLADLRKLVSDKEPSDSLFRRVTDKTGKMLKKDLEEARAYWIAQATSPADKKRREKEDFLKVETVDGEVDFHALRHTYATMLVNSGTDVKTAQSLLRHSSPMLTLGIYTHVYRESEQAAVEKLPSFENVKPLVERKKA
jgi:integrase